MMAKMFQGKSFTFKTDFNETSIGQERYFYQDYDIPADKIVNNSYKCNF